MATLMVPLSQEISGDVLSSVTEKESDTEKGIDAFQVRGALRIDPHESITMAEHAGATKGTADPEVGVCAVEVANAMLLPLMKASRYEGYAGALKGGLDLEDGVDAVQVGSALRVGLAGLQQQRQVLPRRALVHVELARLEPLQHPLQHLSPAHQLLSHLHRPVASHISKSRDQRNAHLYLKVVLHAMPLALPATQVT